MENGAIITLMDLVSDLALNLYGKNLFLRTLLVRK